MALPLPRRVIRKLLRTGVFSARRILEVGCEDGRLVRHLQAQGRQAAGIDDRPGVDPLITGLADTHHRSLAGGFPFAPHHFDAIVIRGSKIYSGDLLNPEASIATANLLSSLAPRRRAIFLATHLAGDSPLDTWIDSLHAHLAPFPGAVEVSQYVDGWEKWLSLEWLIGRHRHIDLTLVTFTAARKPVSRLEWHQLARQAVMGRMRSAA
jgi:SAM-dependent methyltransferase